MTGPFVLDTTTLVILGALGLFLLAGYYIYRITRLPGTRIPPTALERDLRDKLRREQESRLARQDAARRRNRARVAPVALAVLVGIALAAAVLWFNQQLKVAKISPPRLASAPVVAEPLTTGAAPVAVPAAVDITCVLPTAYLEQQRRMADRLDTALAREPKVITVEKPTVVTVEKPVIVEKQVVVKEEVVRWRTRWRDRPVYTGTPQPYPVFVPEPHQRRPAW